MDYNLPERRRKNKILIISLVCALVAAVVVFFLLRFLLGGGNKKQPTPSNETSEASYYISDMRDANYKKQYDINGHKLEFFYGYERTNYKYNIVVSMVVDDNVIVFGNNRITIPIKKLEDSDKLDDSLVQSSLGTYLDWISAPTPAKNGDTEYFVVTLNTIDEENKAYLFDVDGDLVDDNTEQVRVFVDSGKGVQRIYATKAFKENAFKNLVSKTAIAYSGMQNIETGVLVKQEIALFNDGTYFEASDMNGKSASEGTYRLEGDKLYLTITKEYGRDCCYYDVNNGLTTKFTYSDVKLIGILTIDNINTAFVLPKTDPNSLAAIKDYVTANDRCYCGVK